MFMDDCIFCKINLGIIPAKKIADDENFFAILDTKPKADGHTLIISKQHFENLLDMPASLGNELMDMVKKISLNLIDKKKAEGVNVISNVGSSAGQVVHHVHIHIVPRIKGDGLRGIA